MVSESAPGSGDSTFRELVINVLERLDAGATSALELACSGPVDEALAVEEALQAFEKEYPRKAEVVTLSFFGGLTAKQIAQVLDVSSRTVESDWHFSRAWLNSWLADMEKE